MVVVVEVVDKFVLQILETLLKLVDVIPAVFQGLYQFEFVLLNVTSSRSWRLRYGYRGNRGH